jgi:hypothetical protein
MFTTIVIAGCGNSCFVGFSNNGNGGVIVKAGNPPPVCSLAPVNGTMRAVVLKSPVCETCTAETRVHHIMVTVRSIQLRPATDSNTLDSFEIAPHLANQPRQIDLIGDPSPEILVQSATVPAGSYREVRVRFFSEFTPGSETPPIENACGETRWNCVIKANGEVEPLHFTGDVQELLIPIQSVGSNSFVVLPDSWTDLRLTLESYQQFDFSSTEGWKFHNTLVGHATAYRQWSPEPQDP